MLQGNTQTGGGGNNPQVQGNISTGSGGNINLGLQAEKGGTANTGTLVSGSTVGNFNSGNQGNVTGNQVGGRDASSEKGYGVGGWTQK